MRRRHVRALSALGAAACCCATAQTLPAPEVDPLSLQVDPPGAEVAPTQTSPLRLAVEAGVLRIDPRSGGHDAGRLLSIDARWSMALSPAWRATLSNRYDYVDPPLGGQRLSTNSLREAFVGWQEQGGSTALDAGRINHRQGPAYGYNPTDYFRRNALRSVTSADPIALRERRLGTVMLRANQLWANGSMTAAWAPRLASTRDDSTSGVDLAATNSSHRLLLGGSWRGEQTFSLQGSALFERGRSVTLGASATQLIGSSLVLYGEASHGKSQTVLEQVTQSSAAPQRRSQAAAGLTYTFPSALAVTVEAEYNGNGLNKGDYNALSALGPLAYQRYFALTQGSQELGSRSAWLVYVSQKGLGLKQLDLTGFVRTNSVDDSRLWWAELRYHWNRVDGVLQWQRAQGRAGAEFGVLPVRQAVQLSAVFYL